MEKIEEVIKDKKMAMESYDYYIKRNQQETQYKNEYILQLQQQHQ